MVFPALNTLRLRKTIYLLLVCQSGEDGTDGETGLSLAEIGVELSFDQSHHSIADAENLAELQDGGHGSE